jgi:hypothetical protein
METNYEQLEVLLFWNLSWAKPLVLYKGSIQLALYISFRAIQQLKVYAARHFSLYNFMNFKVLLLTGVKILSR